MLTVAIIGLVLGVLSAISSGSVQAEREHREQARRIAQNIVDNLSSDQSQWREQILNGVMNEVVRPANANISFNQLNNWFDKEIKKNRGKLTQQEGDALLGISASESEKVKEDTIKLGRQYQDGLREIKRQRDRTQNWNQVSLKERTPISFKPQSSEVNRINNYNNKTQESQNEKKF